MIPGDARVMPRYDVNLISTPSILKCLYTSLIEMRSGKAECVSWKLCQAVRRCALPYRDIAFMRCQELEEIPVRLDLAMDGLCHSISWVHAAVDDDKLLQNLSL